MRDFSQTKRIVIKVGTNVLTDSSGVDTSLLRRVAHQISQLVAQNRQVILVTSGAIGMGAKTLGIKTRVKDVKMRQACAAVGQGILMHEYQKAFSEHDQKVAQVLLTNRIMSYRKYYVNLKNAVEQLLSLNIVPIINENDCVSIDEIDLAFGDNDRLSALVASKIDAELLIVLTDVDGLYDSNPAKNSEAQLISLVPEITDEIAAMAGKAGSQFATGGMESKINAIRIAADSGCKVVLANGRTADVALKIVQGQNIGTLFLPRRRLSNRKRWILNSHSQGTIEIDPGAVEALRNHRSLLLVGVTGCKGNFNAGDVVTIANAAKGVARMSAADIRRLLEAKNQSLPKRKTVIHLNDMVLLD
ncbi:MAG: glutamate 5-kinase [Sedimentisphaerales bacterium]|nr:glutamate 5-kinase [Sedimentisphaerales bacterium]